MFHALPNVNNKVLTDGSVGQRNYRLPICSDCIPALIKCLKLTDFGMRNRVL